MSPGEQLGDPELAIDPAEEHRSDIRTQRGFDPRSSDRAAADGNDLALRITLSRDPGTIWSCTLCLSTPIEYKTLRVPASLLSLLA